VVFLPTGRGGFVLAYEDTACDPTKLSVTTRVETDGAARRAMYLGDYLYVFGENDLVVLDESDWSTVTDPDIH
jgi:uncharacterized secreted protein with C-terminal beta-propeller domain